MKDNIYEESNQLHRKYQGKIEVNSKIPLNSQKDLSLAYTPGVAQPCREIQENPDNAYVYTSKGNMVAIITDGSAVLGLGNIGAQASLPVMEGKAILFKHFAQVDSFPICIETQDVDKFVETVAQIAPSFGGINLEDISAPRCFEIENKLKSKLNIPVFHDDQHGTAIVAVAAMINALKMAKKSFEEISVVINGAGAAGVAIAHLLHHFGTHDVILLDSLGIIHEDRVERMNPHKLDITKKMKSHKRRGGLEEALKNADVFIGVSQPNILTQEMVKIMAPNPIIFALANPVPEIMPEDAKAAGALVVCTGRSDFPNQVNNVLAFPGLFRGALDLRASEINEEMKVAATIALANLISDSERSPDYVIPKIFDTRVAEVVANAVREATKKTGADLLHKVT